MTAHGSAIYKDPRNVYRRPFLSRLELHVTHTCNLACESCSHYSNHGHSGNLALDTADRWMSAWSRRIDVKTFNLLGGEPTIHPELPAFVGLVRSHWPKTMIRITTNGFFLHRHPTLPAELEKHGPTELALSIHHKAPEYIQKIRPVETLLNDWRARHGINLRVFPSERNWTRRYLGEGKDMRPFTDGKPRESWEVCKARECKQLFEGNIWKCGPLAYLGMQDAKYGLGEDWRPYLSYQPLVAGCSDKELRAFVALEHESVCSMCSAENRLFELPLPLRNARPAAAVE